MSHSNLQANERRKNYKSLIRYICIYMFKYAYKLLMKLQTSQEYSNLRVLSRQTVLNMKFS